MLSIKRRNMILVSVLALVAFGGAAFAYWTTTGSGTDSAATGTNSAIVVNQTSTVAALAPGVAPKALSGDFDNPNASSVYVGSVSATITGTNQTGCTASDYTIAGTAPVNSQIAPGDAVGSWSGLTIEFANSATVNQNACKGATVAIAYTSN